MDEKTLIEKLNTAGHRVTTPRLLVWRALVGSPPHPSVGEIHERLTADHPTVGLATVYTTLDLFEELGIVRALTIDGVTHYDARREPHVNLICERCGRVQDVTDLPVTGWQREVERRSGFETIGRNVDFYGVCPACRAHTGEAHTDGHDTDGRDTDGVNVDQVGDAVADGTVAGLDTDAGAAGSDTNTSE